MNTGTQRSSASPAGAVTTTTPILAKLQHKKRYAANRGGPPHTLCGNCVTRVSAGSVRQSSHCQRGARFPDTLKCTHPALQDGVLPIRTSSRWGSLRWRREFMCSMKCPKASQAHLPLIEACRQGSQEECRGICQRPNAFQENFEEQIQRLQEFTGPALGRIPGTPSQELKIIRGNGTKGMGAKSGSIRRG